MFFINSWNTDTNTIQHTRTQILNKLHEYLSKAIKVGSKKDMLIYHMAKILS